MHFPFTLAVLGVFTIFQLWASDCFFLEAEALYLRAYQGGLSSPCDSVDIVDATVGSVVITTETGTGHEPRFKWNPGFRLGVGYDFGDNISNARLFWTHLDSKTGGNSMNWKLDYNVVDLLCGYNFNLPCDFTLIAFAGLKYANINQRLHTNFLSVDSDVSISSISHVKQDLSAIGPCVGLAADFNFGSGFGLYGNVAVSCLYGKAHIHFNQTDISSAEIFSDRFKNHPQAYQYVIDAGLGIDWKTTVCEDKWIALRLGFETHRFFNHNRFFDYGDLSLDGLTLGASFYY